MPVVKNDTLVAQTVINRCNKTQFNNASALENNEVYAVDPEFTGGKLLTTDADGEIVESSDAPATVQALSATDSITLADNTYYQGGTQTALTVVCPATASVSFVSQITFRSLTTPTTFTESAGDIVWNPRGDDITEGVFLPVANKDYTIIIKYDGFQFVGLVEGIDNAS